MRSAYVEEKDYRGLLVSFDLHFGKGDKQFVRCFIWRTVRELRKNTYFPGSDHLGAYVFYPYRARIGLFGEIHLIPRMIGAGYVAHEIQHFLFDWLLQDPARIYSKPTNEKLAMLAECITSRFWTEFYKNFERKEK